MSKYFWRYLSAFMWEVGAIAPRSMGMPQVSVERQARPCDSSIAGTAANERAFSQEGRSRLGPTVWAIHSPPVSSFGLPRACRPAAGWHALSKGSREGHTTKQH